MKKIRAKEQNRKNEGRAEKKKKQMEGCVYRDSSDYRNMNPKSALSHIMTYIMTWHDITSIRSAKISGMRKTTKAFKEVYLHPAFLNSFG